MNERIKDLENKTDRQEQYSRLNCILLIHGIAENKEKNTDQQAVDFIYDNLDIKINGIELRDPTGLDVMTRQEKKQELL